MAIASIKDLEKLIDLNNQQVEEVTRLMKLETNNANKYMLWQIATGLQNSNATHQLHITILRKG